MRVVVFGASGRTGRLVVERALREGYEVVAFARDASKLGMDGADLRVVEGDVLDAGRVREAVAGADAVLSALGHVKGSEKDVQTRGTRNIIAAMKESGVRRVVSLTGAGVRDPKDEPKLFDRVITALLGILQKDVLEDGRNHVSALKRSGLDWTVVRGPMLTDGEATGEYRVGLVGKNSGSRVSRADVAGFMLRQLRDGTYIHRMPVVSY